MIINILVFFLENGSILKLVKRIFLLIIFMILIVLIIWSLSKDYFK